MPLYAGRMDAAKVAAVRDRRCWSGSTDMDEVFVCGPESMIHAVRDGHGGRPGWPQEQDSL